MSTTAPEQTTTGVTTFRGRSLEELLPQIREQLGPDAIVLKQRDGLVGGIGGFFQQRFVEVDARAGAHRIDVYDEEPAAPEPEPDTFAQLLADAETLDEAGPRISASDRRTDPHSSTDMTAELTRAGMSASFAEKLTADAEAHELPFADGDIRTAVRRALARKLPTALPHRAGSLAVAFVGPGSTSCADALAAVYKRAGRDARALASLDKARVLLERDSQDAVIAVDLPPVATERAEAEALARHVEQLALDEVVAVIPAELELPSARALLDRLQPLSPTALALSLDVHDAGLGAAVELACTARLPILYAYDGAIARSDAMTLTDRLLP